MKKHTPIRLSLLTAHGVTLLMLLLSGCVNASPSPGATDLAPVLTRTPDPRLASAHTLVDHKLVSANTRFGFKLFSELVKQDSGKNIFISPASIAFALAMTYNGAAGETQPAMAETLELQGMSLDEVNQANDVLRLTLENPDPQVRLTIANSLWARKDFPFKPDFIQRNKDFYGAEVANLDFGSPDALSLINAWVSKNTAGKIDKIVEQIDPRTILFLINAVYFKGAWSEPFDPKQTKDGPFTLLDGGQKQVPMMSHSAEYNYYRGDHFQAISLPYGGNLDQLTPTLLTATAPPAGPPHIGNRVSLYIFLPDPDSSLEKFYETLNAEDWESWMSRFTLESGALMLPRFKYDYESELKEALTALGMGIAFDPGRANFEGMVSGGEAYIGQVKHKAFVEVNEQGTEAAAATVVAILVRGIFQESFRMTIDRPFFFAIRDNVTGTILFMGSVVEPK